MWHHLTTAAGAAAAIRASFYISASAAGGVDISARAEAIDVRAADNRLYDDMLLQQAFCYCYQHLPLLFICPGGGVNALPDLNTTYLNLRPCRLC